MAKISPVSIKYMIHANFVGEGGLEKPDVIGAIFGQTEGLLGADLEMRDLQKEGKIGRIEVDLEKKDKRTIGKITIPTALDQSETTLIAAAIETIDRIGPTDAQIEVEKIEDVRGSKRDYILERAKKLMGQFGDTSSREISQEIKYSARASLIQEYGKNKLPCGDLSGKEIIVVEGRADVVNMLRNHVDNVVGMNGTKLPDEIKQLGEEKELTLFVDGDRGGILIAQNVVENANVKYIAMAPEGKEVEELTSKEILQALRKKVTPEEFFAQKGSSHTQNYKTKTKEIKEIELSDEDKNKMSKLLDDLDGKEKTVFLDGSLNEMKTISTKAVASTLKRSKNTPSVLVVDGTITKSIVSASEEVGVLLIIGRNFATTDTSIKLLSL